MFSSGVSEACVSELCVCVCVLLMSIFNFSLATEVVVIVAADSWPNFCSWWWAIEPPLSWHSNRLSSFGLLVNVEYDFTFQIHLQSRKTATVTVQTIHLTVLSPCKKRFILQEAINILLTIAPNCTWMSLGILTFLFLLCWVGGYYTSHFLLILVLVNFAAELCNCFKHLSWQEQRKLALLE